MGKSIMGTDFSFELRIVCNAGAFVSGEETALINSVQGSVAEPRPRPPFPAQKGLNGQPTCINNVETWANVPLIIKNGANWFKDVGVIKNGGTKLFSLSGKIKNTGLVEIPMGTSLREVVFEIGGGIIDNKPFKAVQTGGPAGGCIPDSLLDLPLTYEGLSEAGAIMGSGGMIVLDSETCMVDMARYFLEFSTEESCGKCTPCREGTVQMLEILNRICAGEGREEDLAALERLASGVAAASLCGLGQNASNPVLSTLKYFRHEYETHIREKRCKPGVCLDLVKAKCINACPLEQDVPGYLSLIKESRYEEAYALIYQTNPMPGICGRVCPHPCMDVCVRNQTDDALSIAKIKRFAADMARRKGIKLNIQKAPSIDQKVAVIGGGPGGVAVAYHLELIGYQCMIFEELPKLGGMLRYGIPGYRLPRDILDEEIDFILNTGVEAKTGVRVGDDIAFEDIQKDYDAVFVGVGAHKSLLLNIPGEDLTEVKSGIEFLREAELGNTTEIGQRVAVVGGGNAAIDVARTCRRMGAGVEILYRRERNGMPAYEEEIEDALAEGITLRVLVAPKSISRDNGFLKFELFNCKLGKFDRSGRRRPVPMEDNILHRGYDTIFSTIGQIPDLAFTKALTTKKNTISVDSRTLSTNLESVFAGGDAVTGPARVVDALAAGKRAAVEIDRYLAQKRNEEPFKEELSSINVTMEVPAKQIEQGRFKTPELSPEERIKSFAEVELGFDENTAKEECNRCLRCDVKEVASS